MGRRVEVNEKVFEQLTDAFIKQYGKSVTRLIKDLNEHFSAQKAEKKDLISSRTLFGLFNSDDPGKRDETYLNYLCIHLLDKASYQDAVYQSMTQAPQGSEASHSDEVNVDEINALIKEHYRRNEQKHGYVKPLDKSSPVRVRDIYVDLQFSQLSRRNRSKRVREILRDSPEPIPEEDISAFEGIVNDLRLLIWGRLGGGKTVFLKNIAARRTDLIPVFIGLKEWSEDESQPGLLDTIFKEFLADEDDKKTIVKTLIAQRKIRVLLDGLDEVDEDNSVRIQKEINHFARTYPDIPIVATSRIGGYVYNLPQFTEVEIADLTRREIEKFIVQWFDYHERPEIGKKLLAKLEKDASLFSFATSPMQLTMLCLSMDGGYGVPENRFSLYDNAVKTLLERRDQRRWIERRQVALTKQRKINFLSQLAYEAFQSSEIKYEWHELELKEKLREFIENISLVSQNSIEDDIDDVLDSLESHHGLLIKQSRQGYTFSSVAFQEYFAALYIVESRMQGMLQNTIQQNFTNRKWRSIFIMIAERLPNADEFLELAVDHVNSMVETTPKIQQILSWIDQMTHDCHVSTSSWRAGCLAIDLDIDFFIDRFSVNHGTRTEANHLAKSFQKINSQLRELRKTTDEYDVRLFLAAVHSLAQDQVENITGSDTGNLEQMVQGEDGEFARAYLGFDDYCSVISKLEKAIEIANRLDKEYSEKASNPYTQLTKELIVLQQTSPSYKEKEPDGWIKWADSLRETLLQHLNIGHNIELTPKEARLLEDYCYANGLLLECLKVDSVASRQLRLKIRESLLLPATKLKN